MAEAKLAYNNISAVAEGVVDADRVVSARTVVLEVLDEGRNAYQLSGNGPAIS